MPPIKKKKPTRKPNWEYVNEDEVNLNNSGQNWKEIQKKAEEEAICGEGTSRRKTREKQMIHYNDGQRKVARSRNHSEDSSVSTRPPEEVRGFDRGLEPEKILAATEHKGVLLYYVKWEGKDLADLVLAVDLKKKYPKLIASFLADSSQFIDFVNHEITEQLKIKPGGK